MPGPKDPAYVNYTEIENALGQPDPALPGAVIPGRATVEHDDAARGARLRGLPLREVLSLAAAAARRRGSSPDDLPPGGGLTPA